MFLGAQNPERVLDKIRECRFFLAWMADHERASETENLLFCLSAFLSAFRSAAYRLYGVAETQRGKAAKFALKNQLHAHPTIGFLIAKSNVEIHEAGVTVWQRYTVSVGDSIATKWPSRWNRRVERWSSRFESRFQESVQTHLTVRDWQFAGNPSNLIVLCHDALGDPENFIRQNISLGQQVP
jgi:hypothetical protein